MAQLVERPLTLDLLRKLEREGKLTQTRLDLSGTNLSFDRYEALGRFLGTLRDTSAWALGDWLIYGEGTYGEKYAQAVEATGRTKGVLTDYRRVAEKVPPSRRRADLTWSHHRLVANMTPADQRNWLAKAARHGWSREEFKGAMSDSGTYREPPPRTAGVVDDLRSVLRLVVRYGQPDGNGYVLLPIDVYERVKGALGEE